MTAIAPHPVYIGDDRPRFVLPSSRAAVVDGDCSPDTTLFGRDDGERLRSPWRAPLFYIAFLAGIVLLMAVAVILLWRVATGTRQG